MSSPLRIEAAMPGGARGFVLVGVAMFVLVLTILGLSLFSLSGFEAQFMNDSLDKQEAFYAASGGIERAKWVMLRSFSSKLQDVHDASQTAPVDGVVYSAAKRAVGGQTWSASDSTGDVPWGQEVWIRALAVKRDARSMLEERFVPIKPDDIYKRLITSHNTVTLDPFEPSPLTGGTGIRWSQTFVSGNVWQNSANTAWAFGPNAAQTDYFPRTAANVRVGGVPAPAVPGFLGAHIASATDYPNPAVGSLYTFTNLSGVPQYFKSVGHQDPSVILTIFDNGSPIIAVTGLVVWLLPEGAYFDNVVKVTGLSTDCLVIVAGAGTLNGTQVGAVFHGGLNSVPNAGPLGPGIIVVSNSLVSIKQFSQAGSYTDVKALSVFAEDVSVMGPETNTNGQTPEMHLKYDPTGSILDSLIEQLNRGYPPDAGPAWRAACQYGFDMSLVEDALNKTPEERLEAHQRMLDMLLAPNPNLDHAPAE
jgi:hypothetical protein